MRYQKIIADKEYSTIYHLLKSNNCSEIFITSLRKARGLILKNKEIANTRTPVKENDEIEIALNTHKKSEFKTNQIPLNIVFEDDYLLIVNKPANLTCSPSKSHYDENLAGAILGYMLKKDENFVLRMINRLDKDTSGIIIVAKDTFSYANIGEINKSYHAVCSGIIDKGITIDKPILTINNNGINQLKRVVSNEGKKAKTYITPIKQFKDKTLLSVKIEHGRTHQIRVHLSSIEHPLIGDELYGEKSHLINHTALICKEIEFKHPITKQEIHLEIEYPEDFKNLLASNSSR